MKQRRFFLPGILLFTLLISSSCSDKRKTVNVMKEDIVESVYSSVVLEPRDIYTVNASVSGYIEDIPVAIGEHVSIDDVLFSVRDVQSFNQASNAKLAYDQARRNLMGEQSLLEDLKLEIANALLKRKNDSTNYYRNKELHDKGLLTDLEFEQSELRFFSSKNAHMSLVHRYNRTKKDLQASMEQARNNYSSSQSRSDDAIIKTKIKGVVYDILKEPGEFVTIQQPVAIIGSQKEFKIKMLIDEVDITKVNVGQTIIVSLEAYNNKTFKAEVTHISPKMDERTQTFEITGRFIEKPSKLYMGLTGEANIVINERENVLVIPREYLINGKYVETDNGRVKVKTGIRSLSHVEIVDGISEGTTIYKPE